MKQNKIYYPKTMRLLNYKAKKRAHNQIKKSVEEKKKNHKIIHLLIVKKRMYK